MIEFKNVSVNFKLDKKTFEAVNDVSFRINKGEIFGIAGSSGAGKSTLLRTVNLLQQITKGSVFVDGDNITCIKGNQLRILRRNIGMIFQHFNLAGNLTVYQNIAFVLKAAGKTKKKNRSSGERITGFSQFNRKNKYVPGKTFRWRKTTGSHSKSTCK